ncbi:MAG: serine--tRNA ligase [Candidatus Cloacimonetes bacterium]|jgi:seryl-tRNA synthetase|nr:serine--tRNA ligase [Candidatus Cloacimonadota bacterium]MBT6994324.1 serine--tRNA ligase [Candidatus Cloacimonadota bacterium]MBT7469085.1 serine--tRNA ligase [Candidatus Cloacimonadota bacterium]
MLDLKFIRENAEKVRIAVKNKNEKADVDAILELDEKKRKLQFEFDNLRAEQNKISQQIPTLKKKGEDVSGILAKMKNVSVEVKSISSKLTEISENLEQLLLTVPNIPHADVPIGNDESDNVFVREWGKKTEFAFDSKEHLELCEQNNLLDLKRATKLSGSGFVAFTHKGAMLERALINFMLDFHVRKHNYEEISLPILVNRKTMIGTGQLPKLADDMYHVEQDDLFLVPTAEVSVTNFYGGEILANDDLPKKFISYSPCFRREAGSYGQDTKGLQRIHQFNKVEMVRLVEPEKSYEILDEMVGEAEAILQALGLHYRVLTLATGDLSFASAKTYDLEVWAPASQKYLEVSSISNFMDFQSRRASLRYRDENGKVRFLHTLNGSGLATPRTFIALIEAYQNADGSIEIPEVLRPYLGGLDYFQNIL